MNKLFVSFFALLALHFSFAQRQTNTEIVPLRVSNISFQDILNNESNALNYHKTVNQAFKDILDGSALDGITALKPALYSSRTTMPIDWFVAGYAYALLNEKQGVDMMLNEALSRDKILDSLVRTPFCSNIFGGLLGEQAWNGFLDKKREFKNRRADLMLINTLMELERLEIAVEQLEKIYKDSILVHHKNDKKVIDKHQTQIQVAKVNRDKGYAIIIDSEAWPFHKMKNIGQTDIIEYDDTPNWYQINEAQLINMLYNEKLLPWEFAFIHDWHAKRHRLPQKYALFYGQRLDEKIVMNCEAIGMPWGEVRDLRLFYIFPEKP